MAYQRVCSAEDVWQGDMEEFEVAGTEIVLLHTAAGEFRAIPASCPHQDHPLIEGEFDGQRLTCGAHLWQFDVSSGAGINPDDARLCLYAVKIENGDVYVDVERRMNEPVPSATAGETGS